MISLTEVKDKCRTGRFFAYDNWRDKLLVPPSIFFVWLFVNLGWSGNAVSWLSGAVAISGGILLAANDQFLVLIGTCSYIIFYFLDYVDGGVARFKNEGGIEGQYIDWIMHAVSAVALSAGIFVGALNHSGAPFWLVPFGILFILASVLQLDRFALGWWAICMYRQQNRANDRTGPATEAKTDERDGSLLWKGIRAVATVLFHENYAIYVWPALAIINIIFAGAGLPDFRLGLTLLGGTVYFANVVREIDLVSRRKKLGWAYNKLFLSVDKPVLPAEHFFL